MPKPDSESNKSDVVSSRSVPTRSVSKAAASKERIAVVVESRSDWESVSSVVQRIAMQLGLSVELLAVESISKSKTDPTNGQNKSQKDPAAKHDETRGYGSESLPIWAAAITKSEEYSWIANARVLPRDLKLAVRTIHQTSSVHSVIGRYDDGEPSDWMNKLFLRLMIRCVWLRPPNQWQRTIAVQYKNSPNSSARLAVQLKKRAEKQSREKEKQSQSSATGDDLEDRAKDSSDSHFYSDLTLSWAANSSPRNGPDNLTYQQIGAADADLESNLLPELLIVNESQSLTLEFSNKELSSTDLRNALLLFPIRAVNRSSLPYEIARRLRQQLSNSGFALIKEPSPNWRTWVNRFETWVDTHIPQMEREARKQLSGDLDHFSSLNGEFLLLVSASAFLAAFGLVMNSASVIIGAMLIAPLMTPIQGIGLALTNGNRELFLRAIKTVAIGFLFALCSGMVMGLWLRATTWDVDVYAGYMTDEIWARCKPSVLDFAVGFVGGAAAAFARTRSHLADALAGAAIAAALVPPIATAGLQIAMWPPIDPPEHVLPVIGPAAVFLANVLTITIGTSIILWLRGIRTFHEHGSKDRWSNRMYILLAILAALFAVAIMRVTQNL